MSDPIESFGNMPRWRPETDFVRYGEGCFEKRFQDRAWKDYRGF